MCVCWWGVGGGGGQQRGGRWVEVEKEGSRDGGEGHFDYEWALDALGGQHAQWSPITSIFVLTFFTCVERERGVGVNREHGVGYRS